MTDWHLASFSWPTGPYKVVVTGSFDSWSGSQELEKNDSGFSKTIQVPWDSKISYKYIVDGEWKASPSQPQEYDGSGNLNNVYTSPPKPATTEPPASVPAEATADSTPAATTGTSSIFSYVKSSVGAAIATVTGVDPVNPQHIPVEEASAPVPAPEKAAPATDSLAPIKDEPVVLHLSSDAKEQTAVPIPSASEPIKETNGTLPAETESPVTDSTSASHPTEGTATTAVDVPTKETTTPPKSPAKKEEESTPRTSNASPPTTPRKFSFPKPRRSGSITGSSVATDDSPVKRKKRDSFFGKIKDVFHSPKKEKPSSP